MVAEAPVPEIAIVVAQITVTASVAEIAGRIANLKQKSNQTIDLWIF